MSKKLSHHDSRGLRFETLESRQLLTTAALQEFVLMDFEDAVLHDEQWLKSQPSSADGQLIVAPKLDSGADVLRLAPGEGRNGGNALVVESSDASMGLPGFWLLKQRPTGGGVAGVEGDAGLLLPAGQHANRLEFWLRFDEGFRFQHASGDGHQSMHVGTYHFDPGQEGVAKESNNWHFYYQIFLRHDQAGAEWMHVVLNEVPHHIRGVNGLPGENPTRSAGNLWELATRFYIDNHAYFADPEVEYPVKMWVDDIKLSYVPEPHSIEVQIDDFVDGQDVLMSPEQTYEYSVTVTNTGDESVSGALRKAAFWRLHAELLDPATKTAVQDISLPPGGHRQLTLRFQPDSQVDSRMYHTAVFFVPDDQATVNNASFHDVNVENRRWPGAGPTDGAVYGAHLESWVGAAADNSPPDAVGGLNFVVPADTPVSGYLPASDPDRQKLTYTLEEAPASGTFAFNDQTGQFTFTPNAGFEGTVRFKYRVSDGLEYSPARVAWITVSRSASLHSPLADPQVLHVAEDSPGGVQVGTLRASDPNANDQLAFHIVSGNEDGLFTIDHRTGVVTLAEGAALDHEARSSYDLGVKIRDDAGLFSYTLLRIAVDDVNEFTPVVAPAEFEVARDGVVGELVGIVQATDSDTSQSLTYAITGGDTEQVFQIAPNTGAITVRDAARLNGATSLQYQLTVTATDDVEPARSGSAVITVNVSDVGSDLVAHWDFNDAPGGVVADASAEGADHPGILSGDARLIRGEPGSSLRLGGAGGGLEVADSGDINLNIQTEQTISTWFYVDELPQPGERQVIYEQGGTARGLNIYLDGERLYVGGWNEPASESGWAGTFLSTADIRPNSWHHVALVLQGGETTTEGGLRGYLDGQQFGAGPASQLWAHSGDIGVGGIREGTKFATGNAFDGEGAFLTGGIDDLRIHKRALNADEVASLARELPDGAAQLMVYFLEPEVAEGNNTLFGTVRRFGDASRGLTVQLSASDASEATVPETLEFAPGQSMATFPLTSVEDGEVDGTQTVVIEARSPLAKSGDTSVQVRDDDVATTSLVAHWNLNDGQSTMAADSSPEGRNHSAILMGDARFVSGSSGYALRLDGNGDYLAVPNSPDINDGVHRQRTVAAWFYLPPSADHSRRQVVYEEGGATRGLNVYLDQGRLYVGGWNKPANESNWQGTFLSTQDALSAGWHHVALVLDGTDTLQPDRLRGYVDGRLFGSGPGSQLWPHTAAIAVGRMQEDAVFHDQTVKGHGADFAGDIDDVRIYNRPLDPEEVAALARAWPDGASRLSLSLPTLVLQEGSDPVEGVLTRSGRLDQEISVEIAADRQDDVDVPAVVTIPAHQASVPVPITVRDNLLLDGERSVSISTRSMDTTPATAAVTLLDDEQILQPVASWQFDQSGGIVADTSLGGGDNPGFLSGDALIRDGGLHLDGDGDYVAVNDSVDINLGIHSQRTVSAWFYLDASGTGRQVIYEEGGTTRGLNIYVDGGHLYVGGWNEPRSESGWTGTFLHTGPLATNTWHHVGLVLQGSEVVESDALVGYLDGARFASGPASQVWEHGADIAVGAVADDSRFHTGTFLGSGYEFQGVIDDVRVYNTALSATNMATLASATPNAAAPSGQGEGDVSPLLLAESHAVNEVTNEQPLAAIASRRTPQASDGPSHFAPVERTGRSPVETSPSSRDRRVSPENSPTELRRKSSDTCDLWDRGLESYLRDRDLDLDLVTRVAGELPGPTPR